MDLAPSSIFDQNRDYIVFDLETKDLVPSGATFDDLANLGVSVGCAWDSRSGEMLTFFEDVYRKIKRPIGSSS